MTYFALCTTVNGLVTRAYKSVHDKEMETSFKNIVLKKMCHVFRNVLFFFLLLYEIIIFHIIIFLYENFYLMTLKKCHGVTT